VGPKDEVLLSLVCPTLEDPSDFIQAVIRFTSGTNHGDSSEYHEIAQKTEFIIVSPSDFNLPTDIGYSIVHVEDQGKGIYHALNLGISRSCGRFILVINIDDLIDLSNVIRILEKHLAQSADVIYGNTFLNDDTQSLEISIPGSPNPMTISSARMPASHQAQLVARDEYFRLNGFQTEKKIFFITVALKYASDFDFYCRSIKSGASWKLDENLVALQRMGGTTSIHWFRTTIEILFLTFIHSEKKLRLTPVLLQKLLGAIRFHYPRQSKRRRMSDKGELK
jgi:glycosyltransferase involved in cell wall biosynthesis